MQTDQWLLMLTFIRLYWSSCIDIDTQMRHPSTSRGKVSIILKSISECMQHTASHVSWLFFSVYFPHALTNSQEFCSITKCMQSTNHPAFGSSHTAKRSLRLSFEARLWSHSLVIFHVMESALVRGMLWQKSQRGRTEGKCLGYVLCFMEMRNTVRAVTTQTFVSY